MRPRFVITIEALPEKFGTPNVYRRLARLLKSVLRQYGFRCLYYTESLDEENEPGGAAAVEAIGGEHRECVFAGVRGCGAIAENVEHRAEHLCDHRVVIEHEDVRELELLRAAVEPTAPATPLDALPDPGARFGGGRIGRNDPCPCGSGRKFKKCHGA